MEIKMKSEGQKMETRWKEIRNKRERQEKKIHIHMSDLRLGFRIIGLSHL